MNKDIRFNVVTRASRKNYFKICYDSIHCQTYKNFKHIVTYETEEMHDYLKQFEGLTLVKVPNKRRIEGLQVTWRHNCNTEDYLNPDHEFLDYQALNREEDHGNNIYVNDKVELDPLVIKTPPENGIAYHHTGKATWREYGIHAPYNWYLKIAEKAFEEDAWIIYVDDDDQLFDKTILDKLQKTIVDYGSEDVLHINQFTYPNGDLIPDNLRCKLYSHGFPFVHRMVSTVCLCYHSKYSDYTYWDEWSSADYRTARALREIIPNLNISDLVAVKLTNGTNGGLLNDI